MDHTDRSEIEADLSGPPAGELATEIYNELEPLIPHLTAIRAAIESERGEAFLHDLIATDDLFSRKRIGDLLNAWSEARSDEETGV